MKNHLLTIMAEEPFSLPVNTYLSKSGSETRFLLHEDVQRGVLGMWLIRRYSLHFLLERMRGEENDLWKNHRQAEHSFFRLQSLR